MLLGAPVSQYIQLNLKTCGNWAFMPDPHLYPVMLRLHFQPDMVLDCISEKLSITLSHFVQKLCIRAQKVMMHVRPVLFKVKGSIIKIGIAHLDWKLMLPLALSTI